MFADAVPRRVGLDDVDMPSGHIGLALWQKASMGEYAERFWHPEDAAGLSHKDRVPGRYLAYVPNELGARVPVLGPAAHAAAEDALAVLARADERIGSRGHYLNHLLIRSESISSSWIEGNRVTPKRLAIAELLHYGPRQALDVVANVRATEAAIADLADRAHAITTDDIVDLQHVIEPRLERGLRQEQNWVGGPGWSPLRAAFVPPPETEVPRLVEDLARFTMETAGNRWCGRRSCMRSSRRSTRSSTATAAPAGR